MTYNERLNEPGTNLADTVKQASRRARIYQLADDGASNLAHQKRSLKESIANRKILIAHIEQRQAGEATLPPRLQSEADRFIVAHRQAIRELKEQLTAISPATPVIAPMTRRVAREDRRRERNTRRG